MMGHGRQQRVAHWRGVLERQAESGLGVAQFCRQESVSAASFYFWRRRLHEQEATTGQPSRAAAASRQLLPVQIAPARPAAAVRILLPQGVALETSASIDVERLTALLQAVQEASGC